MSHLLDTDTCIHFMRYRPPEMVARIEAMPAGALAISAITHSELWYGVMRSARPAHNIALMESFLLPLRIISYDETHSDLYARTRIVLEKRGTPIGAHDMLIAAQALRHELILVTNNTREFARISGLRLENWIPAARLRKFQ